jgi:hypothetical protein
MAEPITQEAWEAKGAELFGDDMANWRFVCPACKAEMSIAIAREKHPEVKGRGWRPEQECIGRYTHTVDCDWCAYGLFHGPVFVRPSAGGEPIPVFDFAGLPFTKRVEPPNG